MESKIKRTIAILLVVLFLVTMTAGAVSASDGKNTGRHGGQGETPWYRDIKKDSSTDNNGPTIQSHPVLK